MSLRNHKKFKLDGVKNARGGEWLRRTYKDKYWLTPERPSLDTILRILGNCLKGLIRLPNGQILSLQR